MKKVMQFLEKLSRDEMRTVVGGYDLDLSNCYNCCESAIVACQVSCGAGGQHCDLHQCIYNQWEQCRSVLGCIC